MSPAQNDVCQRRKVCAGKVQSFGNFFLNRVLGRRQGGRCRTEEPSRGGRIPTLPFLTDVGADLVESVTGNRPQRVLRSRPAAVTFLNRREIVRVMRAFDIGCDAAGLQRPDWIMEQDAWHTAPKHLPPNQKRPLYHDFGHGITCLSDIACRLTIGATVLVLFWEIDLSTEGCKQLRTASKTDGYVELIRRGVSTPLEDLANVVTCYG